jgi:hypothetical protein
LKSSSTEHDWERISTVLSLPLHLVFPDCTHYIILHGFNIRRRPKCWITLNSWKKKTTYFKAKQALLMMTLFARVNHSYYLQTYLQTLKQWLLKISISKVRLVCLKKEALAQLNSISCK